MGCKYMVQGLSGHHQIGVSHFMTHADSVFFCGRGVMKSPVILHQNLPVYSLFSKIFLGRTPEPLTKYYKSCLKSHAAAQQNSHSITYSHVCAIQFTWVKASGGHKIAGPFGQRRPQGKTDLFYFGKYFPHPSYLIHKALVTQ